MNTEDLKTLADRATTIEGRRSERLTDVHDRIHTARRRRATAAATGVAGLVAAITVLVVALSPGARVGGTPVEPARPHPSTSGMCATSPQLSASNSFVPAAAQPSAGSPAGPLSIQPLAGSPGHYGYADGTGANARFDSIEGLAVGSTGIVYVSDFDQRRSRIRSVAPDGRVSIVADRASATWDAGFQSVAVDASGRVYAVLGQTVRRIEPDGGTCVLAGDPAVGTEDSAPVDGTGRAARFGVILGMTVGPTGDLYVTDAGSVRKITPQGQVQTLPTCHDTWATAAGSDCLGWPGAISVDSAGTVYIGSDDYAIRTITPDGVVGVLATGDSGGTGLFHRMSIAFDPTTSTLLVMDTEGLHGVTQDGKATLIDALPGRNLGRLAVGADGTLYSTEDQSAIVTISRT